MEFVKQLQAASRDNLDYIKGKAIRAIYDLLRAKPEQEAVLLMALVDKLGDPSRKTASHVRLHLPCLCTKCLLPATSDTRPQHLLNLLAKHSPVHSSKS